MAHSAFSRWFRGELERRDLGVAEAAAQIGISHSMVSRYQNGAGDPLRKTLRKIAAWSERPPAELEAMLHEAQAEEATRAVREAPAVYTAPTADDIARSLRAQGLGTEVADALRADVLDALRAGWARPPGHRRTGLGPPSEEADPAAG